MVACLLLEGSSGQAPERWGRWPVAPPGTKERATIRRRSGWRPAARGPTFGSGGHIGNLSLGRAGMAERPIWRGHLRLALVTCPVALHSVLRPSSNLRFHFINPKTGH